MAKAKGNKTRCSLKRLYWVHRPLSIDHSPLSLDEVSGNQGVRILPNIIPSRESVAKRHNTLLRMSTPGERKIVEKAIIINDRCRNA